MEKSTDSRQFFRCQEVIPGAKLGHVQYSNWEKAPHPGETVDFHPFVVH